MRCPLPPIPPLTRHKITPERTLLLGCPRISPEWELGALRALIKPQTGTAICHLPAAQTLPHDRQIRVNSCLNLIADRLGYRPDLHWPDSGDYFFIAQVPAREAAEARALAVALSRQLPATWLALGQLFIRDGAFFRRQRGFKLALVPASNIHLPRPIRSTLIPKQEPYYHHDEGNSDSHVKASLVGNSVTVLIEAGRLVLGRWQGIYFCEFDGPRERKMQVKLVVFESGKAGP